jgi:hypothetical protein
MNKVVIGEKYGFLTVTKRLPNKSKRVMFQCLCDCGELAEVRSESLLSGHTKSCGCLNKKVITKHGLSKSRLHNIWSSMKAKCSNPRNKMYVKFGYLGISVCKEWESDFEAFKEWALSNSYNDELELIRNDEAKDFEPSNCLWVTHSEQCNRKYSNTNIAFNGECYTLSEWAKKLGTYPNAILARIKIGWNIERALSEPFKPCKTHGMNKTRIHSIWLGMKNRCNNPKNQAYKNYGGRGITYQASWEKFENFYEDMKESYADNLTIERIDNNGNYTKDNCCWATKAEQNLNTRHNKFIEHQGKTQALSQWATDYNMSLKLLSKRLINGWDFEDALLKPRENVDTYFHSGETGTLKEWSDKLSIPYQTLVMRLHRNWSIERAFTTPTKIQYRKNK